MRFVVVGAGAVGGALGALLARAGRSVVLVARGAHGRAIAERGLTVRTSDFEEQRAIECVDSAAKVRWRPGDVAILGVKTHDVESAVEGIDPAVPVACTENGVLAEEIAARRFADVSALMSWIPAVHLEPGVVEVYARAPWGVFRAGTFCGDPRPAAELTEAMSGAGLDAELVSDIMRHKRAKLLNNLGNVLDAYFARDPRLGEVSRSACAEGAAVLSAAGLDYVDPDELLRDMRQRLDSRATIEGQRRPGGSTWQSLMRGLDTELNALNGWICELGSSVRVPTPLNSALMALARRATGARSVSIAELSALIGGDSGAAHQ